MAKLPTARSYFDTIGNSADDGINCKDVSLTVQASKDECDINVIVNRYNKTGELPVKNQGIYADISNITNLQSMIHQVMDAQEAFDALPANIRTFFANDPTNLVNFAQDPRNADKAIELGLATKRVEPSPSSPAVPGSQPSAAPGASEGGA
jgi:phage internal scaffolding protein